MTFYPIPDDPDFQPIARQRTTLPDDYARCHGVPDPVGMVNLQCLDCLRRNVPYPDNVLYSYMTPPDFTTACPERIAPCQ